MKKLYAMLLTLFCVLSASALPEELYLVGSFNNYSTPDTGKDLFILKPTGTEGTYSGTFDIPAKYGGIAFKVFSAKTNDEGESYGSGDIKSTGLYLYSDINREIKLVKISGPSFVYVNNWKGGKITFTCTLNDSGMNMTLITPDQPKTSPYPENIYVIGDFNDWAIPNASSDNGAIKMSAKNTEKDWYEAKNAAIPSGKARFIYYYIDPIDNKGKFIEGPHSMQETDMFKYSEHLLGAGISDGWDLNDSCIHENLSDARAKAANIINYTGPDLTFYLQWDLEQSVPREAYIEWMNAPVNEITKLYLYIENLDTDEKTILSPDQYWGTNPHWDIFIKGNVRIWLTESNTLPLEKKWGAYSSDSSNILTWGQSLIYCVPDGKPISINTGNVYGKFIITFLMNTHQISIQNTEAEYYDAEKLYVIGYMDEWRRPIEDNASLFPTLEKVSDGVYEGVVNFPRPSGYFTDPQFRLHYKLDNWDNPGSIGSWYDENTPKDISFTDSQFTSAIFTDLKGNWRLPTWENDGDVRIHVDFNDMTMSLTNLSTNSVKGIESENMNAPVLYFNLQGQRVNNPSNGIFIRVQGAKSEKVILN